MMEAGMTLFGSRQNVGADLARFSDEEVARLAQDAGMDAIAFTAMVEAASPTVPELVARMAGVGLDVAEVAASERAVMRDLVRVCSLCGSKRQCHYDLAAGITDVPDYCHNKDTLTALIAEREAS
jgi:hypothetical protein